jgi:hypothetical protein
MVVMTESALHGSASDGSRVQNSFIYITYKFPIHPTL